MCSETQGSHDAKEVSFDNSGRWIVFYRFESNCLHHNHCIYLLMMKRIYTVIRRVVLTGRLSHISLQGPFNSWQSALMNSNGWDSPLILQKVSKAIISVLKNEAVYERDGVTFQRFPKKDTVKQLIEEITQPRAHILDFGGGLGGLYLANRIFLDNQEVTYSVIEQQNYVAEGKKIARDYDLPIHFFSKIHELGETKIDLLILSGVAHCVEDWNLLLKQLLDLEPDFVIVDRTPLSSGPTQHWVQNNVDYYLEDVSYPSTNYNKEEFLHQFHSYTKLKEWKSDFDPSNHYGFLLKRS